MPSRSVVLVYPKVMPDLPGSEQWTLLPLSLLFVAAPLVEAGYEVTLIDQRVDEDWRARLEASLMNDPLCVGLSVMTGFPIKGALAASELVKRTAPSVPIVWGGVHPSLLPEQTVASPYVDVVVSGEGEKAFLALVTALDRGEGIQSGSGVYLVDEGEVKGRHPNGFLEMASLPRPAYGLVDIERYRNAPFLGGSKPLALSTSRGCPWRCRYCYNLVFNRRRWRSFDADRTLAEISYLQETYGIDSLFLLDDNFFVNEERVREICERIVSENRHITFLNANVRIDTLDSFDPELLPLLRRAGFEKLFVGVESGSDRVLAEIDKGITTEQIRRVNRSLREAGMTPVYSFMVGFPDETVADMRATLRLMVNLLDDNPDAVINPVNIFSPFPGTPLFDRAVELGMPEPGTLEGWAELDYVKVNYRGAFSAEELAFMQKAFVMSNLVDPKLVGSEGGARAAAKRAYAAFARARIRRGFYGLMPELRLSRRFTEGAGSTAPVT